MARSFGLQMASPPVLPGSPRFSPVLPGSPRFSPVRESLQTWLEAGDQSESEEKAFSADPTREEAGEELASLLLHLKQRGKLSAKDVCVVAWWATGAGASGPVCQLAFPPDRQSTGHYQRHIDNTLGSGLSEADHYLVAAPRFLQHSAAREVRSLPILPPHECLHEEALAVGTLGETLRQTTAMGEWPPAYYKHPVVQASAPGTVSPLCLYLDGVVFAKKDSVLGLWCFNLQTGVRHLLAGLRRTEMCKCGCRGWCTLHPIFSVLAWSFKALCEGTFPAARHDAAPLGKGTKPVRLEQV